MSERYKVIDDKTPTFITCTLVGWVDLFTRRRYTDILYDAFNYCIKEKGLNMHAFVFMTNHIHIVATSSDVPLNQIIRDFKKHTSKEFIKAIKEIPESRRKWMLKLFSDEADRTKRGKNYKVWKDGFHPITLDTDLKLTRRINYTHNNPVVIGLVNNEANWAHSSYLAYTGESIDLGMPVRILY